MSALANSMLTKANIYIIMVNKRKVNELLRKYLETMPTTTPDIHLMQSLTLRDIRPRGITQAALAKELGRNRTSIVQWEMGRKLDGINSDDIVKMAILFDRRVEEIVAAIQQTRSIAEEETEGK